MRLYHLVMYNLSGIQKGIQALHSALEYAKEYGTTDLYKDYIDNHKTTIVLDGGGSGQMVEHIQSLLDMEYDFSYFKEPDLNDSISAITFLVPERIYDGHVASLNNEVFYPDGESMCINNEIFYRWLKQFNLARN